MENESEVGPSLAVAGMILSTDNNYEIPSIDIKQQLNITPTIVTETKLERIKETTPEENGTYEEIQQRDIKTIRMSIKTPPEKPPRPQSEDLDDSNECFLQDPTQKHKTTKCYSQPWILYMIAITALILAIITLLFTLIQFGITSNSISSLDAKLNVSNQMTQSKIKNDIQAIFTSLTNEITQLNSSSQGLRQEFINEIQSLTGLLYNSTRHLQSLVTNLASDIRTLQNHLFLSTCKDISLEQPSGLYWVYTTTGIHQVYCDINATRCTRCNNSIGWTRVANFDLTDPTQQNYPEGFSLLNQTTAPFRTVGRPDKGCASTTYNTFGIEYSNVCGRIVGYQYKHPDAFSAYYRNRSLTIDSAYVDGVSLTHGQSPRQHIWTFVGASREDGSHQSTCPCTTNENDWGGAIPPFIENDYFCDTGTRNSTRNIFFADDPLWDGQGCGANSTCCEFNSPPWFCTQLPQSTTDDIELRLCGNTASSNEDTRVEIVELYIS